MAYQPVDIGSAPNDGTGDPIRDAFDKVNDNFVELYAGLVGLLDFKGSTDCSANPNYPAASKGDYYLVSVAGKIGGASGIVVSVGDSYFATADNAGGTQAGVGTSWTVIEGNLGFAPVNKAGDTMTGDLIVPDEAYDATAWNGSLEVPTKNAVRDKIEALAGSVFTAASTTEVLTGTDSAKGATPDALAALWEQGADVASAGTTSLGEGGFFHVTGTTTITDIDFATDKAGRAAWVEFTGILTLTHNASTLILPTGASITTAAGDTACFVSEGSDVVRCVAYNRASGAALVSAAAATSTVFEEQRAANVAGGPAVSGAWYGRSLNAEAYDEIGLSLRAATFTVTIASPGLFTWTAHGLVAGSPVVFTTSGALPTGLTAGTTYWVIAAGLTANDFEVSATQGGAAVNTSGSQSGTHTGTSSTVSLAVGTYTAVASAQHFSTDLTRIRLRDLTNSVTLCASDNMYGSNANAGASAPRIDGKFALAGTAIVQLEYRATTSRTANGLGVVSNWGDIEIYSRLKLTKTA